MVAGGQQPPPPDEEGEEEEVRLLGAGLLSLSEVAPLCGKSPSSALRRLQLHGNRLATVAGLRYAAPSLEQLVLSSNELKTLEGIGGLGRLQVLDVSSNHLETLRGLEGLESLEELAAAENSIDSLDGLLALRGRNSRLRSLDLRGNRLGACEGVTSAPSREPSGELVFLGGLDQLQVLRLQNKDGQRANPICRVASYRSAALRSAASLLFLDEEAVSSVSRYAAHCSIDSQPLVPPSWPREQPKDPTTLVGTGGGTVSPGQGFLVGRPPVASETLCELRAELQKLQQAQRVQRTQRAQPAGMEADKAMDHALAAALSRLEDLRQEQLRLEGEALAGRARLELERNEEGKLRTELQIVSAEAKRRAEAYKELRQELALCEQRLQARQHQAFSHQHRTEELRSELDSTTAASAVLREEAAAASASFQRSVEKTEEAETTHRDQKREAEVFLCRARTLDEEILSGRRHLSEEEECEDELRLELTSVESRLESLSLLSTCNEERSQQDQARVEMAEQEVEGFREEVQQLNEVIARQTVSLHQLQEATTTAMSETSAAASVLDAVRQEVQAEVGHLERFEVCDSEAACASERSRLRHAQEREAEEEEAKTNFEVSKAAWNSRAEDLERWAHALRSEAEREERSMRAALDAASEEKDEVQRLQEETAASRTLELDASECASTAQARLEREAEAAADLAEKLGRTHNAVAEEQQRAASEFVASTTLLEAQEEAASAQRSLAALVGRRTGARDEEGRLKAYLEEAEQLHGARLSSFQKAEEELSSLCKMSTDEQRSMDSASSELQAEKDRHTLQSEDLSERAASWRRAESDVAKRLRDEQEVEEAELDEEQACHRELERLEATNEARDADLAEAAASADAFEERRRERRFTAEATIQELRAAGMQASDDARTKLQALDQQLSKELSRHQKSLLEHEQHLEQLEAKVQSYQSEEESMLRGFREACDKRAQEAAALAAAFRA